MEHVELPLRGVKMRQPRTAIDVPRIEAFTRNRALDPALICESDDIPAGQVWIRAEAVGQADQGICGRHGNCSFSQSARTDTKYAPSHCERRDQSLHHDF